MTLLAASSLFLVTVVAAAVDLLEVPVRRVQVGTAFNDQTANPVRRMQDVDANEPRGEVVIGSVGQVEKELDDPIRRATKQEGYDERLQSDAIGEWKSFHQCGPRVRSGKVYVYDVTRPLDHEHLRPVLGENGNPLPHTFDEKLYNWASYVHDRFLTTPQRTNNPHEAELFYVPLPDLQFGGLTGNPRSYAFCNKSYPPFQKLTRELSKSCFFKRSGGRDHVMAFSRNSQHFVMQACPFGAFVPAAENWTDPVLKLHAAIRKTGFGVAGQNHHAMPSASWVHYDSRRAEEPPWRRCANCRNGPLMVFVGSIMPDRTNLIRTCENAGVEVCHQLLFDYTQARRNRYTPTARIAPLQRKKVASLVEVLEYSSDSSKSTASEMEETSLRDHLQATVSLYRNSTFCLMPPGDEPDRKGVWDALLNGCIPVIFDRMTLNEDYAWHVPDAEKVAVVIDGGHRSGTFLNVLQAMPKEKIARLQENIEKLAPSLQYTLGGKKWMNQPDAFDVLMQKAIKRVRE